jgi:hypothetical protein
MAQEAPSTARLEAFSDGVIAVIITVMVLEIKVPHLDGLAGLRQLAPALAIYLLSFAFTGIYWINHQHVLRRTEKAGHAFNAQTSPSCFACRCFLLAQHTWSIKGCPDSPFQSIRLRSLSWHSHFFVAAGGARAFERASSARRA